MNGRPLTLLVVHSDYGAVRPLIAMLDAKQQRVVAAEAGVEALERAAKFQFDAVLAERRLRDMSWEEFVERATALVGWVGALDSAGEDPGAGVYSVQLPAEEGAVDALVRSVAATRERRQTSTQG